jgi:hypothetical protein
MPPTDFFLFETHVSLSKKSSPLSLKPVMLEKMKAWWSELLRRGGRPESRRVGAIFIFFF